MRQLHVYQVIGRDHNGRRAPDATVIAQSQIDACDIAREHAGITSGVAIETGTALADAVPGLA
ncbi:MAG: hypothetical protein ACRDRT_12710 [Pseudonocardiaceae bacterium]